MEFFKEFNGETERWEGLITYQKEDQFRWASKDSKLEKELDDWAKENNKRIVSDVYEPRKRMVTNMKYEEVVGV